MRCLRLIASVFGAAALLALCAPGAALAGTYSWSQPGDFSGTPGTNPEQKYGQPSWGYYGTGGLMTYDSSLPGWRDASGDTVKSSGGDLVVHAVLGKTATVVWSDPFDSNQPVTWTASYNGTCLLFNVEDQSGNTVPSGTPVTGSLYLTTGVVSAGCTENVQIQLQTVTPSVTLTNPVNGAAFTNGAPQFAGTASTAFDASMTVTVAVFAGGSAGGSPIATLPAAVAANGSYTATPTTALPSGTYTALTEQDDPLGQANFSAPVTFTLASVAGSGSAVPGLTLNSPGSKPLTNATPTLTGTAGIQAGDSNQVTLLLYPGTSVGTSPVRTVVGNIGSDGQFAIKVTPAVADGAYTAVAAQTAPGVVGFSPPVSFRVKVNPPALTLTYPQKHGSVPRSSLFFYGRAGGEEGDSGAVTVRVWRGTHARGKALGTVNARVRAAGWGLQWPRRLSNGRYTVRAVQSDDAGHTTTTQARSFTVVPGLPLIRSGVSLASSGRASLRVSCLPRGQGACRGTVLVVTTQNLRPTSGGPAGPVRVMFASVNISDGQTALVGAVVPSAVARALRGVGGVTVRVTVALRHSSGLTSSATAARALNISP